MVRPSISRAEAQVGLLVVLTLFVGAMWGMERTVVPLLAREEFGITSAAVILSFIVGFGLTKAFANLFAGGLMDRLGRRTALLLGWSLGVPVPFLLMWAPRWEWVVAANLLLGANQGLCWTATILMMMDWMGARHRGLAVGLNEFAGYGGAATTALATGAIAAALAPRPYPFLIGAVLAPLGLLLSLLLVRETAPQAPRDVEDRPEGLQRPSYRATAVASVRDGTLATCNQGGLVTKINDATMWGLVPLFLASQGLDPAQIGLVGALYPAVWGVCQFGAGALSDRVGRKPIIALGMAGQGAGLWLLAAGRGFPLWLAGAVVLGLATALVYPTLIAAVGDHAHPLRRASAVGIYRWFRDGGFVVGALVVGLLADALGFRPALFLIGGLSLLSALGVATFMRETAPSMLVRGPWQPK